MKRQYSIIELRGLMKICLDLKLGHTATYRGYKEMLKQLEQEANSPWRLSEALRDWKEIER